MDHEGIWTAAPLRYALGDLPFRDEIGLFGKSFDILFWPVFSLFPGVELYALRLVGVGLIIGASFCFYLLLKRFCPPWIAAAALVSCIYVFEGNQAPGYQLMGTHLLYLSAVLWCVACVCVKRKRIWTVCLSGASGYVYTCGLVSNFNLLLVPVIPGVVILVAVWRKRTDSCYLQSSVTFLGVLAVLVVASLLALQANGLTGSFFESYFTVRGIPSYDKPVVDKVVGAIRVLWSRKEGTLLLAGAIAYLSWVIRSVRPRKPSIREAPGYLAFLGAVAVAALVLAEFRNCRTWDQLAFFAFDATVGLNLIVMLDLVRRRDGESGWAAVWVATMLFVGSLFAMMSVFSGNGPRGAIYGIAPMFALGIVGLARCALALRDAGTLSRFRCNTALGSLGLFCLLLSLANFAQHYQHQAERDEQIEYLTSAFSHPKLTGIVSSPRRVSAIEQTADYLRKRVRPGDYLFVYDGIPMMYYLTDTRPAVRTVYFTKEWNVATRAKSVEYMIEQNRIPLYAVRCLTNWFATNGTEDLLEYSVDPAIDPASAYIERNYRKVETIFPFEIWQRDVGLRDGPSAVPHERDAPSRSFSHREKGLSVCGPMWSGVAATEHGGALGRTHRSAEAGAPALPMLPHP